MARVDYEKMAPRYDAARALARDGLADWRRAVERWLPESRPVRIADVGAGTGLFACAFADWFDAIVIGIEPSSRMREQALAKSRHEHVWYAGGDAERIPLRNGSCDVVWLSTVIHHVPDLARCARETRRILRRGGRVLIRSAFPGRLEHVSLFRFFPGARKVAESFPTVEATVAAFASAGLSMQALESVAQVSARSMREGLERVRLRADSTLAALDDEEFARGLAAIAEAARLETTPSPIVDRLDLLVLGEPASPA